MGSVTINIKEDELKVLTAYATITSATVESIITRTGVTGAIQEAMNNEVNYQVSNSLVSLDIKNEMAKEYWLVQQKVNNLYQQGTIHPSVISGLETRAASI